MIKVNCVVESVNKKNDPQTRIEVNSVDDSYSVVELVLVDRKITVFSDDIVTAIENCSKNGRRRWRIPYERQSSDDEE